MSTPDSVTLQRLLLPNIDVCAESELYVKCKGGSCFSHASGVVRVPAGSWVQFDTYFNSFSVGKWRRHTAVENIVLRFEASGDFEVEAVLNHPQRSARVVAAAAYASAERGWFELGPFSLAEMGDGQLYLKVRSVAGEAAVFDAAVTTPEQPPHAVRVGVVITTYNRPEYLERNLSGLATALKDTAGYDHRLDVLVVDNGSNVDPAAVPPFATVLPNKNLGGAGGFARGLISLRDAGTVSHVLFMDDDITFEPETIFRTVELLSYARDDRLCVAGAMLVEEAPYVQFEAGASFAPKALHPFHAIGSNVDLRDWRELMDNEVERPAGYGAWWYFAFPLHLTDSNPLPVFVRGDDVCFGLRHTGRHTITLNGIGVWHQAFAQKNGPAAFYYEARNLALVSILSSDTFSARHLVRRFVYHTSRMLLAMKYDTAAADIEGMRQFLEGPDAWMAMNHEEVNQEIRRHAGERPLPLSASELATRKFRPRSRVVPTVGGVLSILCLSGHALPSRFNRRAPVALNLDSWSPVGVLGREQVQYRFDATGEGFSVQRDRRRFFALLAETFRTAARIPGCFDQLKADYRAAYPTLTGEAYWRRQFGEERAAAPVTGF